MGDPSQPPQRGQWGRPDQLSLPLDDRGLNLADGLFETVLVEQGQARLLDAHLERWRRSAALLGMEPPPTRQVLEPLIAAALQRSQAAGGAMRLNWSRGSAPARGIDLPADGEPPLLHRFWLQFTPLQPSFRPVTVWISQLERRQGASLLSQCKTFAYGQAIQARREARSAGAEEALLLGTGGELCCGATANLLLLIDGTWLTPPLASGCLPGVMRARALELGLVHEATLDPGLLLQSVDGSVHDPSKDSVTDS
ncbi:MAG: 4-amino-4-deoxychorismate lyase, partial [Synechococcus sp. Baikal-G1]